MRQNFFKYFSIIFLLAVFWLPQNTFAQNNANQLDANEKQIIKRYLSGDRANYTFEEKQIVNEYLKSTQKSRPNIPNGNYSPDAVILTEDFDAVTPPALPAGWVAENTNADASVWESAIWYPRSDPNSMRIFYNAALAMDDWFFTPGLTLTGGVTYRVRFWYAASGSYDESLEVKWGTSATSGGMTGSTIFDDPLFSHSNWEEATGTFTPSTTGTYYVGWHGYSAADQWFIVVDDIVIDEDPSGPPDPAIVVNPLDAAIDVSIGTTLDWFHDPVGATPTGYRVYFGTDVTPITLVYDGPLTSYTPPSALANGTTYYWQVIAYNGAGDATGSAIWSFTTITACAVLPLPTTVEDFETSDVTWPPECWTIVGPYLWDWAGVLPLNGISAIANFWDISSGTSDLVSLEYDASTATVPQLTFDWAYATCGNAPDEMDIYTSTDGGTTWTLLLAMPGGTTGILNPFNIDYCGGYYFPADNEWSTMTLTLPANTTNVSFTAITAWGNLLWLDNIVISGTEFEDSFENPPYAYPGFVAAQNPTNWTTWSGPPYTNEDAQISQTFAKTGIQSALIDFVPPRDVDLVYLTDTSPKTSGKWYMGFAMYIPTGKAGYFNVQSTFQVDWGVEVYFDVGGGGRVETDVSTPFVWVPDQWNQCLMIVDLDNDVGEFWFGPNSMTQKDVWEWTRGGSLPNTLDGYDFFGATLDDEMYIDDFRFSDAPAIILQPIDEAGTFSIDMDYQYAPGTVVPTATVKNYGTATNTFDVVMTITGGYTSTKTVTALAPGASEQVIFDNWTAPTPGASYDVNVCTQLIGDEDPSNDCQDASVTVWDSYGGDWTAGLDMPSTSYNGIGVAYNDGTDDWLFVMGGNTPSTLRTECYKYNVTSDAWTTLMPLPSGRLIAAGAIVGDYIYVIGGSDGTAYTTTTYRYDIAGDSWTTMAAVPTTIGWCRAVGYNDGTDDYIYLAGGYDGVAPPYLSSVYLYDVTADTWTLTTNPMPTGVFGGGFALTGNTLVYAGGAYLSGITNEVMTGTINGADPLDITWVTMKNTIPGIGNEVRENYDPNQVLAEMLTPSTDLGHHSPEAIFPAGAIYRTHAHTWGADAIIMAGGTPTSAYVAADPGPCYVYTPSTDTWLAQENVPVSIGAHQSGSVQSGGTWKYIIASGFGVDSTESETQIYTKGGTSFALTVSVTDGWNMVSVPGTNQAGMGVTTWWSGKDPLADVFNYSGGYNPVTTTTPTEGYWLKNVGPQVYNYGPSAIQIVPHNNVPLAQGWNLIGLYEVIEPTATLPTSPPGIITANIFEYSGGYNPAANIVPGYGYWVKSDVVGGSIGPLSAPRLSKDGGEVVEYFKEDWGKIIITDNAGISYTLYAVTGEVDLDKYELPPMPPAGMFDIRFGSGRIAEDINSSVQSILMSGLEYPVRVRVENMNITLQDESGIKINAELKPDEELTISNTSINKLRVLSGEVLGPIEYALEQNYPNPFNPATTIKFSVPEATNVTLTIYNTLGEKVTELVNGKLEAGRYSYQWEAGNIATGMYIYELRTEKFVSVKKMILLK